MLLTGVLALLGGAALTGLGSVPGDLADFIDVFTDDSEGDISGTITSTNGDPMENVTVSVVGESISAETNNVGYYILQNIPVGDHEIKVEKAGYNTIVYKTFVDPSDHHGGGMGSWDDFDTESKANNEHDFTLTEGSGTIEQGSYPPWDMVQNIMVVCGAVLIVAGIVVIVGAYSAYKRKNFPMAIIGAVVAMITGIGLIFGLIAIFILALSRDEFRTDPEEPWRR